jgi:L-seryl-tRNA(Ser) seleniumtransferase
MAGDEARQNFRLLPSVEKLASHPALASLGHETAVRAARAAISEARAALQAGEMRPRPKSSPFAPPNCGEEETPTLRRAINATGVLLHTNLGRATLAPSAAQAVLTPPKVTPRWKRTKKTAVAARVSIRFHTSL